MKRQYKVPKTVEQRTLLLEQQRNLKMAQSAHAYVRGNTRLFYQWLAENSKAALPNGPPIWICGDCHLGNLGPVGSATGDVEMAARGSDLPGVTTALMIEHVADSYAKALRPDDPHDEGEPPLPEAVHVVMRTAVARSWKHLARERLEDEKPTIPIGKRFWPLLKDEKEAVTELFKSPDIALLATMLKSRPDGSSVELVDAAYWVKGCSSLGRLRIAAVLAIAPDGDTPSEYCLIDVKEAIGTLAPHQDSASMPKKNGARVVEGARHLSPYLGDRMASAQILNKDVFLRELLPQDLKLEIDRVSQTDAIEIASFLAGVLGKAHARQLGVSESARWRKEVVRKSKTLDAPSWLWSSVVDLVAGHEAGYLEHCRRYALTHFKDQ
jgi:uncharacterized protein (DUF2252 family)